MVFLTFLFFSPLFGSLPSPGACGLGKTEGHGLRDLLAQVQSKEETSLFFTLAAGPLKCGVVPAPALRVRVEAGARTAHPLH